MDAETSKTGNEMQKNQGNGVCTVRLYYYFAENRNPFAVGAGVARAVILFW